MVPAEVNVTILHDLERMTKKDCLHVFNRIVNAKHILESELLSLD